MKPKHPHKYGLMVMVSKEGYKFLNKYKKKLDPNVKFYMKKEFFNDIAPQHISLCYFSYPKKYSKENVSKLVPKINKIAKKYLPLKVKVRGLLGGWELGWDIPTIMWNIKDLKEINKFHNEIINNLKKDIEHFNDPELDFEPHIGIALGDKEKIEQLKKIVKDSKKDPEFELILDRLMIFYPKSPKEILNHSQNQQNPSPTFSHIS